MNEKFYNYRWNAKKEKEEKDLAQLQAQQQQQQQMAAKWNSGRGRGYRPTPYYYGGNDQQYGQAGIRQQYAGGQAAMGFAYMDGGSQATGHYSGDQMMGQPGQFGGQYAPRQQAPQGGGYYPPPQLVRGARPPTRANAECFSCGVVGHCRSRSTAAVNLRGAGSRRPDRLGIGNYCRLDDARGHAETFP